MLVAAAEALALEFVPDLFRGRAVPAAVWAHVLVDVKVAVTVVRPGLAPAALIRVDGLRFEPGVPLVAAITEAHLRVEEAQVLVGRRGVVAGSAHLAHEVHMDGGLAHRAPPAAALRTGFSVPSPCTQTRCRKVTFGLPSTVRMSPRSFSR